MTLAWREVVVIPEVEEPVRCECCGLPATRAEGRLTHREAPLARYTARWRPGVPTHAARFTLFLGNWTGRGPEGPPTAAVADLLPGPEGGLSLRDDAAELLANLARWRPRIVRRADAIGRPLGDDLFAMLDAILVKDPRLAELRAEP